jgi:acyl-coenzyme A thioesterase PaaI-like protein
MTSLPKVFAKLSSPTSMLQLWSVLKAVPGGGTMMGRLVGRMAPYTGSIKPEVEQLEVGYAKVSMRDRKKIRNHLRSVHACALMNLGEMTTGVAMMVSMPEGLRGIPIHLAMDYVKKARGTITGECSCAVPTSMDRKEYEVTALLKDKSGDTVAKCYAKWMIGPGKI